jgi:hypothetical protein
MKAQFPWLRTEIGFDVVEALSESRVHKGNKDY